MRNLVFVAVALLMVLAGCVPGEPEEAGEDPNPAALGRWDVTATRNGSSFPLWFELKQTGETLTGRLQGRSGHALEMETVKLSGSSATMIAGDMNLEGTLSGDTFHGTGTLGERSISWTATRAPELPPVAAPEWGEPVQLFNGSDLSGWRPHHPDEPNLWTAQDGILVNGGKGTDLITENSFWNFKLHLEVNCPEGSNSGIYLRGRYEVQVDDSYSEEPHSRRLGGVYGHIAPSSLPARPPGDWQVFDITLLGRWVTIELNGERIIDGQEIPGITGGALDSAEGEPGPIMIQGDHGAVSYRNITLTPMIE